MSRRVMAGAAGLTLLVAAWVSAQGSGSAGERGSAPPQPIRGFSAAASSEQAARERDFSALPNAAAAEADFDVMTAEPHHTGSPYEIKLADYIADRFKSFGLDVSRSEYSVLVPWPGERTVEIVGPDPVKLQVDEDVLKDDPSAAKPGALPAYNAYSPAGDVTGEVVYANYGVAADYEELARRGVDVKGRIVLTRYGGSWRGIKPKLAAEHGAVGCLIYSDPRDDGYYQGDPFPAGPFRGWGMVQRGSVADMPLYPGDPSTPDRPSKEGVERLALQEIRTLARIPVQPLSYRDGVEILKRLGGPVAPDAWRGALPVTYHLGPGGAAVHMKLEMDYGQRRLIDVTARVTGSEFPDEWVILGAHRDAWVFGASDPVSGHVTMMSVAAGVGELLKRGWRPRRTIVFASWDGEEPGLLGSTEFVEEFARELSAKAVVYLNRDAGAGGPFFHASAVHSLTPFLHEVARSVESDKPGTMLYDTWLARERDQAPKDRRPAIKMPSVGALGSGSDYTAFLDHIGVASLDMGLTGTGVSGTYHSVYDDPLWFKTYIDPHFTYSVLAARVTGVALLRFADAQVLPFDYESYGREIRHYVDEIETQAIERSAEGAKSIDFAGMKAAADAFIKAGADARRRGASLLAGSASNAALADINHRLASAERDLIEPAGLPDRPWFRHTIYAPGLLTGYAVKTIPGVREAVDDGNFTRAAEQAGVVVRALQRATHTLSAR